MKNKKLRKLIARTVAAAMAAALAGNPDVLKGAAGTQAKKKSPINQTVLARSRIKRAKKSAAPLKLFSPAAPMPGVIPADHKSPSMAMDDNLLATATWANQAVIENSLYEGTAFLGYAYLAMLAQRPEYRVVSETIATEATREWIKIQSVGDAAAPADGEGGDPEVDEDEAKKKGVAKAEKIKKIEAEFDRLKVQDAFRKYSEQDGFFGRSHLYLDTGDTENRDELKTSIGGGNDDVSKSKVGPNKPLLAVRNVEAVWVYPANYDSIDPLKPAWFHPETWFVQGKEVSSSRLLTGVAREVPDLLKPQYAFGGLSLSQMVKPYVDFWLETRGSVNALISAFSQMILATDLSDTLSGGGDQLDIRADLFNNYRDNRNLMLVNKASEEVKNVVTPLGTLDALQAQSQEHMASVSRIPLVKLLGIQPAGLNASSEGELITFEDMIRAYQKGFFGEPLNRVLWFVQLSLFGEVDPTITVEFNPLRQMTEKERGEIDKNESETDKNYIEGGVLDPLEVRRSLAAKENSRYHDIDVEDVPEPPQEEDQGGGEGGDQPPDPEGGNGKGGGGDSALVPFGLGAFDEDFREEDHPRAQNGQFGSGGGSSKPLDPKKLQKVGEQMGSNPGGVYKDEAGKQFYVKKGKSEAHVRNELLAGRLYGLAGSPTLNYRHVEGGNHVATEMQKLDKDRAGKLSPAEVKQAQEHFASHAWLANWDAAGTGGDNLGTVGGKPTALDLGGALQYRAQGSPKGAAFGEKVGEIDSLRDPSISPDAAKVFGKMTPAQLKESAQRVTSIPDDAIRAEVKAAGEGEELADKIIARKRDIAKRFGLAQDEASFEEGKHPRDSDGKFSSGGGAGVSAKIKALLDKITDGGKNTDLQKVNEALSTEDFHKIKDEHGSLGEALMAAYPAETDQPAPGNESASAKPGEHVPPGSKKKGAFGGLFKTQGSNEKLNHHLTVSDYLSKPAKSGSHYRNMLAYLIKAADGNGYADKVPALKEKLGQAFANAGAVMTEKAISATTEVENDALMAKAKNAYAKAKEYGWKPSGEQGPLAKANVSPAVKAAAAQAMKDNPKLAEILNKSAPQATPDELKKAKKGTPVPISSSNPTAVAAVKAFNDKWSGKEITDPAALNQKVAEYKGMAKVVEQANVAEQAQKENAAAAAAKKEAEAYAKKYDSPEAKEHFETLSGILGGSNGAKQYLDHAEKKLKAAGLEGKMTPTEAAMVIAYSGSHYREVNQQLRAGVITEQQYAFTKALNQALDKLPPYMKTTYRKATLTAAQAAQYKPGFIVPERGFTSSAKNDGVWSGSHHYVIEGKGGRDIQKLSSHHAEAEVLFKANSHFMVTKVSGNKIHMREMD